MVPFVGAACPTWHTDAVRGPSTPSGPAMTDGRKALSFSPAVAALWSAGYCRVNVREAQMRAHRSGLAAPIALRKRLSVSIGGEQRRSSNQQLGAPRYPRHAKDHREVV